MSFFTRDLGKSKPQYEITLKYTDLEGKEQELHADGLLAICIQHELDHLDGTVFIDHLSRLKYDRACAKLKKRRQQEKKENAH